MKIIVAPDKFKGSLTCFEASKSIADGIAHIYNGIDVLQFPMADGGDGFSSVMQYYFKTIDNKCAAQDPLGRTMEAHYQWNNENKTAIIELAVTSGLVLLNKKEQNPLNTSTFGTGLQLQDAINNGAEKIILGIGGSATNDAGMGILSALGFQFLDSNEHLLLPCGKNLLLIEKIILPSTIPAIKIEIACDVQNIMYGPNGAAYIYGPQKGANEQEVKQLDEGLKHFASVLYKHTGRNISHIPGTGAAGGIAAGLMSFFDVSLTEGTKMIIEASGIKNELSNTDLLITGEGKIDHQSKEGKVVGEIAQLGIQHKIPVVAYCGITTLNQEEAKELGLNFTWPIADDKNDIESSIKNAGVFLQNKTMATLPSIMALLSGNKSL
ncbi:MAG: glycerate kinase [Chitinophagaceae bacterium]